jgi:hypothetical protein
MATATINNKIYTFIGTTDEVLQCGCCGKDNLKSTIVLRNNESGEYVFLGSVCGARAMGWVVKDVNKTAKQADKERKQAIAIARHEHPMQVIMMTEIQKANDEKMPLEQRKIEAIRWREMDAQINADVTAQFAIR